MNIDPQDPAGIEYFLTTRGWLPADARLTGVERAGEGNMNLVLRISFETPDGDRSIILKQARAWVEKYPDIPAPVSRLAVEVDFYRLTANEPALAAAMPALLNFDDASHAATFEDLGRARDYLDIYAGAPLPAEDLGALLGWLSTLHGTALDIDAWPRLANDDMRALNHIHIFALPFSPDGPALDHVCPGLDAVAAAVRANPAVARRLSELGALYLAPGTTLLHGDFYPGSWLATSAGPRIIDPEFGFLGSAEFDIGVLQAHLHLAGLPTSVAADYDAPRGFDVGLARAFAGAELLRRLLGVAQLPLTAGLEQRRAWIDQGLDWVGLPGGL